MDVNQGGHVGDVNKKIEVIVKMQKSRGSGGWM